MVDLFKNLNWFLICLVACVARGIQVGFNFPMALVVVGFLALKGVTHYLNSRKSNDNVEDVKTRISSLESKLALISSTRRNG